jgi:hypothetical protein
MTAPMPTRPFEKFVRKLSVILKDVMDGRFGQDLPLAFTKKHSDKYRHMIRNMNDVSNYKGSMTTEIRNQRQSTIKKEMVSSANKVEADEEVKEAEGIHPAEFRVEAVSRNVFLTRNQR